MTLAELSPSYTDSAQLLRTRIRLLRRQARESRDPEEQWQLRRRIAALEPMLTQMNELADLTAHYYDRGYWRDDKYCL